MDGAYGAGEELDAVSAEAEAEALRQVAAAEASEASVAEAADRSLKLEQALLHPKDEYALTAQKTKAKNSTLETSHPPIAP